MRSNFAPVAAPFIRLRAVSCFVFPNILNLGVTFNLCAAILAFLANFKALGDCFPTVKAPLANLPLEANFAILPILPAPGIGTARVVPT